MKTITLLITLFLSLTSLAQNFTIQVDSLREYRLHLPSGYDDQVDYPLLFAFHGGFGFDWQFENETNFSHYADSLGFIVVYPQAFGSTRSWNTGVCCGYAYNNNINDFLFVEKMIDTISNNYSIDSDKIYSTGFSSGAMFTYALGCKMPDVFAAIAPVSSSMIIDICSPWCSSTPVLHLHAEPDSSAIYHGGYSSNPLVNFYYPPVDSVMQVWSMNNGCTGIVDTTFLANGTTIYTWNNCVSNTYNEVWLADDGGHKWMGTQGTGVLSGDSATQDFYATEVVWNFLKQFSLECVVINVEEHSTENSFNLFPNPASDLINVNGINSNSSIAIYDVFGKQVIPQTNNSVIDIKFLSPGIYYVKIDTYNSTEIIKLLKK